jgi:DNA polymerase III psi subunit
MILDYTPRDIHRQQLTITQWSKRHPFSSEVTGSCGAWSDAFPL